jgi:hypothetical protein
VGIAFEGDEITQEDAVDAGLTRLFNTQLQAVLAKPVQVILDWYGQEYHLVVKEGISEKKFKKEAKKHLLISPKTHTRIEALGLDTWSVRAGFTYAAMETRKMTITLHDTKGHPRGVQIRGDKSWNDLVELLRAELGLQPWIKITV